MPRHLRRVALGLVSAAGIASGCLLGPGAECPSLPAGLDGRLDCPRAVAAAWGKLEDDDRPIRRVQLVPGDFRATTGWRTGYTAHVVFTFEDGDRLAVPLTVGEGRMYIGPAGEY